MAVQGIEDVLQQLQATAGLARNQTGEAPPLAGGFAGELKAALGCISAVSNAARAGRAV